MSDDYTERDLHLARFSLENAPDPVFWVRSDARFSYANRAACESLGYSRDELLAMTVHDIAPDFPAAAWPDFWHEARAADARKIGGTHQRKDGVIFPVEVSLCHQSIHGEEYICCFVRDHSERYAAERALRASEERFATVFHACPDTITITSLHGGRFVEVNDGFTRMTGYTRQEVLGRTSADLDLWVDFEDREHLVHTLESTGSKAFNMDVRLRMKDGRIRFCLFSAAVVALEDEPCMIAFVRDVTEFKEAQQERGIALFALERTPDPVFWLGPDARFIYVNQAACESLGYRREELLTLKVHDIDPAHPAEMWPQFWARLRATRQITTESTHRRRDGSELLVELRVNHLDFEGEEFVCAVAIDITERHRAQEEREAFIAELEAKNAELERFTYTVSHDLKTPLVTIRGFLGLLEKDAAAGDRERLRDDVARITNATETMRQLLEELLELSRIGRLVHPTEEIDLSALAEDARSLLAGPISDRGVEVVIDPHLGTVAGDRPRLLEVFQNLIANAVKFMGEQPRPRVEVGLRHGAGDPVYWVRDNGIGIAPRFHDKVFELFDRLDTGVEGTGIGLALVKRIIEVHGGRVWVESTGEGRGSTFCFTLPATQDSEE